MNPSNRLASIHHNPTPGPSDNEWLYGHNWVTAAILAPHSQWGTIALPILADMYVRKVDIPPLNACLYDLPTPPVAGTHGRPRKYGVNKISLGT